MKEYGQLNAITTEHELLTEFGSSPGISMFVYNSMNIVKTHNGGLADLHCIHVSYLYQLASVYHGTLDHSGLTLRKFTLSLSVLRKGRVSIIISAKTHLSCSRGSEPTHAHCRRWQWQLINKAGGASYSTQIGISSFFSENCVSSITLLCGLSICNTPPK